MTTSVMEDMTWAELRDRVKACDIAVIPIGSTEQHGLHLPFKTDAYVPNEIAKRAAEIVAREGIKVTITPAIPFGTSAEHWKFPGISIRPETQLNLLKDICRSLVNSGFKKIVILNGHGGNTILTTALVEVWRETDVFVAVVNWWNLAGEVIKNVMETEPDHACEMETSVLLALDVPVRMEMARKEQFVSPSELWSISDVNLPSTILTSDTWKVYSLSESGAEGDPTRATKEKGEKILRAAIDNLAKFLRELQAGKVLPAGPSRKCSGT